MKRVLAAVVCFVIFGFLSAAKAETDRIYTVKKGDSLSRIAIHENIESWQEIASRNNISKPWVIHPGQELKLPVKNTGGQDEDASIYTVKKGDWLSKIAIENNVNSWRDIARVNGVKAPDYVIHVGQKLVLPENGEWVWQNHGADKWAEDWKDNRYIKAIGMFKNMPPDVKITFIKIVPEIDTLRDQDKLNPEYWGQLHEGDQLIEMVTGSSGVKENVVVGSEVPKRARATRKYSLERNGWIYTLHAPLVCHNWAWALKEKEVPVVTVTSEPASKELALVGSVLVSITNNDDDTISPMFISDANLNPYFKKVQVEPGETVEFTIDKVEPGEYLIGMAWTDPDISDEPFLQEIADRVEAGKITKFVFVIGSHQASLPPVPEHPGVDQDENFCSATVGAGIYTSDDNDHTGYYGWGKARCRPFEFIINSFKVRVGLFAFGALGEGDDEGYDYDWQEYAIGPSGQLVGHNWDLDLDLGVGKLWNNGGIYTYESEQEDNIFLISSHHNRYARRSMEELWFPALEANLEWRIPFGDTNHRHWDNDIELEPNPHDNQYLEAEIQQDIYDFRSQSDVWTTTPNVLFGGGHDWGLPAYFWKVAAGLDFRYEDLKFGGIKAGYKEFLEKPGDQWFLQFMLNYEF